MVPRLINSKHVKGLSGSLEMNQDESLVRVLTVETDLCLDALAPEYDKAALDELLSVIQSSLGDLYDRAVLRQAKSNA